MIRTVDELMAAFAEILKGAPKEGLREWADANERVVELRRLLNVYLTAHDNPPEGIIGVGAITYAEQMLQEAQA